MPEGGSILQHSHKEVDFTLFDISWVPCSPRLVVCGSTRSGSGIIQTFTITARELKEVSTIKSSSAQRCGTFRSSSLNDRLFCSADFSGNINVWDLEAESLSESTRGHAGLINAIAGGGDDGGQAELVTGGRDGEVKVWDRRRLATPVVAMSPAAGQTAQDCWTVDYSVQRLVAAGFSNGDIKVFDLRAKKLLREYSLSSGVAALRFPIQEGEELQLLAGSVDGRVSWLMPDSAPPLSLSVDKSHTVWSLGQVPGTRDYVACLGSGALQVLRLGGRGGGGGSPLSKVCGQQLSEAPATGLSLHKDKSGLLATTSFDGFIRILLYAGAGTT